MIFVTFCFKQKKELKMMNGRDDEHILVNGRIFTHFFCLFFFLGITDPYILLQSSFNTCYYGRWVRELRYVYVGVLLLTNEILIYVVTRIFSLSIILNNSLSFVFTICQLLRFFFLLLLFFLFSSIDVFFSPSYFYIQYVQKLLHYNFV